MKIVDQSNNYSIMISNYLMRKIVRTFLCDHYSHIKVRYVSFDNNNVEIALKSHSNFTYHKLLLMREDLNNYLQIHYGIKLSKIDIKI